MCCLYKQYVTELNAKEVLITSLDAIQGAFFSDPGTFTADAKFSTLFQQGQAFSF